jgi:hypothetical protein
MKRLLIGMFIATASSSLIAQVSYQRLLNAEK